MRKNLKILIVTLMFLSILSTNSINTISDGTDNKHYFNGIWVATVLNIDYPNKPTNDSEVLKNEAIKILDDVKYMGFDAIFLQVRPSGDALYKSKYYPWSKYLTGRQGLAPDNDFDPLKFWVEEAHKRGLELHAWINPYRVTKKTSSDVNHDFASLDTSNIALKNPSWIVKHSDGNLYLNPGIPEVRQFINDSVKEIIYNYDVDGIHMDDYFYPGKNFDDKETFIQYAKRKIDINDWRRENVNKLMAELSKTINANSKDIKFGISPFGIWANKTSNVLGSDTKGNQSYYDHFADSRKWVKEGIIDYIVPQLYWNIGYAIADYSKLLTWWQDVVKGTGVDLYIGQAAYRLAGSDFESPWYGLREIEKQLRLNEKSPEVKGSIFYNYKAFANNKALMDLIRASNQKQDGIKSNIKVNIGNPSANIKTKFDSFYICGSSDPGKTLFLNGEVVESRSPQGYFGVLLPLDKEDNIFTFSQEGCYDTIAIRKDIKNLAPPKMKTAEIIRASCFPQTQEYRVPNEKITLSCKAPIGSTVTVKIAGKSYEMKPSVAKTLDKGLYQTTYNYEYTIPSFDRKSQNIDLGSPLYTMKYKGILKSRYASGKVGVIMKGSTYYAEVTKDVIFTFKEPSTIEGGIYELYKGMIDRITGMSGNYIRLSLGQWVEKKDVKTYYLKKQIKAKISNADYSIGDAWDIAKLDISYPTLTIADFDGDCIKLNITNADSAATPVIPKDSLFSSVIVSGKDNSAIYKFKLKDNQRIEGYYIQKTDKGLELHIKRPIKVKSEDTPLKNIKIMLDPGHGGDALGAVGPLGANYAEKDINLKMAFKLRKELENYGATVIMTRTEDIAMSLEKRLILSRNTKPDLFISIHSNSMEDNIDISKIEGFSVFLREKHSMPISEIIYKNTIKDLNRIPKGIHYRNFYVVRGTWTPSMLLESGFVPNPKEYEWLIDDKEQTLLAKTFAKSIVEYFIQ